MLNCWHDEKNQHSFFLYVWYSFQFTNAVFTKQLVWVLQIWNEFIFWMFDWFKKGMRSCLRCGKDDVFFVNFFRKLKSYISCNSVWPQKSTMDLKNYLTYVTPIKPSSITKNRSKSCSESTFFQIKWKSTEKNIFYFKMCPMTDIPFQCLSWLENYNRNYIQWWAEYKVTKVSVTFIFHWHFFFFSYRWSRQNKKCEAIVLD